jgi:hypothetical protein
VFDKKKTGFILISEFIRAFIPFMPENRQALVDELLNSLDAGGISILGLKSVFNARGHPEFVGGKKADYEIKSEFFEMLNTYLSATGCVQERVPRDILFSFFEFISFGYDDDALFELIIRGSFKLNKYYDPSRAFAGAPTN